MTGDENQRQINFANARTHNSAFRAEKEEAFELAVRATQTNESMDKEGIGSRWVRAQS